MLKDVSKEVRRVIEQSNGCRSTDASGQAQRQTPCAAAGFHEIAQLAHPQLVVAFRERLSQVVTARVSDSPADDHGVSGEPEGGSVTDRQQVGDVLLEYLHCGGV